MVRISGMGFSLAILMSAISIGDEVRVNESQLVMNRERIQFKSSMDASIQEAILIAPPSDRRQRKPVPMVVSLHSWSADLSQRNELEKVVHGRGWIYLFPNFRGVNHRPEACGASN